MYSLSDGTLIIEGGDLEEEPIARLVARKTVVKILLAALEGQQDKDSKQARKELRKLKRQLTPIIRRKLDALDERKDTPEGEADDTETESVIIKGKTLSMSI